MGTTLKYQGVVKGKYMRNLACNEQNIGHVVIICEIENHPTLSFPRVAVYRSDS